LWSDDPLLLLCTYIVSYSASLEFRLRSYEECFFHTVEYVPYLKESCCLHFPSRRRMQQNHPKRRPLSIKQQVMIYQNTVLPVFFTVPYYSRRNRRKFKWNIWSALNSEWKRLLLHHQMQSLVADLCFRLTLQILCRQSQRIIIRIVINTNTTIIYSSVIPKKNISSCNFLISINKNKKTC